MNQAHRKGRARVVALAEKHNLPRPRVADGLEQAFVALDVIGEAELGRRDAELPGGAAVTQVAGQRDLEAAAETETVDHGERGLARGLDGMQHPVEQLVVAGDGAAPRADLLELGDVVAGGEALDSRAVKSDAASARVIVAAAHG